MLTQWFARDGENPRALRINPRLGAAQCFVPACPQAVPLVTPDLWLEGAIGGPLRGDFVRRFIKADRQACQISSAHGGCLWIRGPDDRYPQEIGLGLHQEVVGAGAAVHPKFG